MSLGLLVGIVRISNNIRQLVPPHHSKLSQTGNVYYLALYVMTNLRLTTLVENFTTQTRRDWREDSTKFEDMES